MMYLSHQNSVTIYQRCMFAPLMVFFFNRGIQKRRTGVREKDKKGHERLVYSFDMAHTHTHDTCTKRMSFIQNKTNNISASLT